MLKGRKFLAIILALVLALSMVACSKESPVDSAVEEPAPANDVANETTENASPKKVAVLLPGTTGYFVATRTGMDRAAEELGLELEYFDAQWDASKQLAQIEDCIAKNVDIIAVCAADADAIQSGIKAANDAGVPILAFTNAIGDDPTGAFEGLVTYVGQSEVRTGGLCAEITRELLGEEGGKVVLLEGRPGTYPQRYRREGFLAAIEEYPEIEVVYTQTTNWEKEEALTITEDLIQKGTEFDLIFAQDDNSAIGAGQALKEADIKDNVKVIGLGGSIDGLQALKDGLIDATTYMSADEEGYMAIHAANDFLKGETLEPVTELIQVEVNLENVDTFKGEW